MTRLLCRLLVVACVLLGLAGVARAGSRDAARAAFDAAELARTELRFAEALAGYERAAAEDPTAPFAPRAISRARWLRDRSEGGFAPLVRLEQVRRRPIDASARAAVDALVRDAQTFPPGRVRAEARLVGAEAYLGTYGDPERAAATLETILADPSGDPLVRGLAAGELVTMHRARGDLSAALEVVRRYPELTVTISPELWRLGRRRTLERLSFALLAGILALGLAGFARLARRVGLRAAWGRVLRPWAVAVALYIGAGAALLGRAYGTEDPRPFLWLGLGVLGLDALARAWRQGSVLGGRGAKVGRAIVCALGVLAVAFLGLLHTEAGYLDGFGL